MLFSAPKIGNMYVDAGVNVVQHVPAGVVGILVDDKVIAAVPAPVRANWPVPVRHLEIETAREPKAVMVAVNPLDVVAVGWAETLEAAVLERMVQMKALVVRAVVPVPMVVADVLGLVNLTVRVAIHFRMEV